MKRGKHISGGERLVPFIGLNDAVSDLLEKGMSHSRGRPDFMQIQFDLVNEPIKLVQPLRIETNETVSAEEGQALARELISRAGVPESAVEKAFQGIAEYWGVRGAVLFDIHSGRRIDGRKEKECASRGSIGRKPIFKGGPLCAGCRQIHG